MEQIVTITSKTNLYAKLFEPDLPTLITIVIANSLFSESRFSRSFIVNNARHLCDCGYRVLIFDYTGMGESHGDSLSTSIASITNDLESVISHLHNQFSGQIVLIGFRGGAIPTLFQINNPSIDQLVLWEPVKKGAELIRYRNLIPTYCGSSQEYPVSLNIGGWYINPDFCEALKQWHLEKQLDSVSNEKLYLLYFVPKTTAASRDLHGCYKNVDYVISDKFWHFGSQELLFTPAILTNTHIKSTMMFNTQRFYHDSNK